MCTSKVNNSKFVILVRGDIKSFGRGSGVAGGGVKDHRDSFTENGLTD